MKEEYIELHWIHGFFFIILMVNSFTIALSQLVEQDSFLHVWLVSICLVIGWAVIAVIQVGVYFLDKRYKRLPKARLTEDRRT